MSHKAKAKSTEKVEVHTRPWHLHSYIHEDRSGDANDMLGEVNKLFKQLKMPVSASMKKCPKAIETQGGAKAHFHHAVLPVSMPIVNGYKVTAVVIGTTRKDHKKNSWIGVFNLASKEREVQTLTDMPVCGECNGNRKLTTHIDGVEQRTLYAIEDGSGKPSHVDAMCLLKLFGEATQPMLALIGHYRAAWPFLTELDQLVPDENTKADVAWQLNKERYQLDELLPLACEWVSQQGYLTSENAKDGQEASWKALAGVLDGHDDNPIETITDTSKELAKRVSAMLGNCLLEGKGYLNSVAKMAKAINADPDQYIPRHYLGVLLSVIDQSDRLIAQNDKLVEATPQQASLL